MARLQELNLHQVNEALEAAAEKAVPLAVTFRHDGTWTTLRSRFVAVRGGHVLIEPPVDGETETPWEFAPADRVGISFKLKHYKHLSTVTVRGVEQYTLEDGSPVPVLSLCAPSKMQRAQRRAYLRADVPSGRIVRASFWVGGKDAEPEGSELECPVWSGQVNNISAGGVQVSVPTDAERELEIGETVGIHVNFGPGQESVRADAQFRHVEHVGDQVLMGFQFLGLEVSDEGKRNLVLISRKVAELRGETNRRQRRRVRA
ncbi:MAG: flagellar brake protein [Phycisphaerae bacterium]